MKNLANDAASSTSTETKETEVQRAMRECLESADRAVAALHRLIARVESTTRESEGSCR